MIQKILNRVQGVLFKPEETWDVIKAEQSSVQQIYKEYLIFLAAIPALSGFLGALFKGTGFFQSLFWAALFYLLSLAGVWLSVALIKGIANNFKISTDKIEIQKLVSYAYTAFFVAGIFLLIPPLFWLSVVGIYGFYLYAIGVPKILSIPGKERLNFTVITIFALVFVLILSFSLTAVISGIEVSYLSIYS
ncbi:DUF1282 domain-containing protein [candidate division KSB1 bacterium]|nr:DUF1282 domain-containing protein [candidate division KSB1 bacterium]